MHLCLQMSVLLHLLSETPKTDFSIRWKKVNKNWFTNLSDQRLGTCFFLLQCHPQFAWRVWALLQDKHQVMVRIQWESRKPITHSKFVPPQQIFLKHCENNIFPLKDSTGNKKNHQQFDMMV